MSTFTEAQAKTKLCQEVFGTPVAPDQQFCVGSACMAWRWYNRTIGEADKNEGHGFCGKGGLPYCP